MGMVADKSFGKVEDGGLPIFIFMSYVQAQNSKNSDFMPN